VRLGGIILSIVKGAPIGTFPGWDVGVEGYIVILAGGDRIDFHG